MTSSDAARWDAIIVGGGHNGLSCALVLAKAGLRTLVLEAEAETGGGARSHAFAPGFRVSSLAHVVNRLHPDLAKALDLREAGLDFSRVGQAPTVVLSRDGGPLVLEGAYGEALAGASAAEAMNWREARAQLFRYAGVLKPLLSRRPPDLGGMGFQQLAAWATTGLSVRRLGREDMRDFLRVLLMNVADFCDEGLADARLKGLLAFDAVLGSHLGPRSPTSLLGLLYRLTGETGGLPGGQAVPTGGMGAVSAALRQAAERAGASVRTGAEVVSILVSGGKAAGVRLADGTELTAGSIISALDPRKTFLDLVGSRNLDTGFCRRVANIRMKGDVAKLHLALDRTPEFLGVDLPHRRGRLVVAPSADYVETAFNPAKYGAFSTEPAMEITLPSLDDPGLAPRGACVLSAVLIYAPYALKEGWETGRPKLLEAALGVLEAHAPGLRKTVLASELLTPLDIERRFRMTGGHWHHGELQADQMLMSRPVFGAAGYETPIDGLFLASAGSHPGGGVSGFPGMNAARRVLEVVK